jgi:hypothetical protein
MGIEVGGTPGGMWRRMSFDDQYARRTRPCGRFMASRRQYRDHAVCAQCCDFVFEPKVTAGAERPVSSRRSGTRRWGHEVSITATLLPRGKSSTSCMHPSWQAGH